MAVGEVVSGMSAAGTIFTFQPAVGVEIMVSSVLRSGTTDAYGLYDGVNWAYFLTNDNALNQKLFITNSLYLKINTVGAGLYSGFSGIQIKWQII